MVLRFVIVRRPRPTPRLLQTGPLAGTSCTRRLMRDQTVLVIHRERNVTKSLLKALSGATHGAELPLWGRLSRPFVQCRWTGSGVRRLERERSTMTGAGRDAERSQGS